MLTLNEVYAMYYLLTHLLQLNLNYKCINLDMTHSSQGITCSGIDNENVYNKASFDGTLMK